MDPYIVIYKEEIYLDNKVVDLIYIKEKNNNNNNRVVVLNNNNNNNSIIELFS